MKNIVAYSLRLGIINFLTANYSNATDINEDTPIYIDDDFDPTDDKEYERLNFAPNYSIVIHNTEDSLDESHPNGFTKVRFTCNITIVRKTENEWDVSERNSRVSQGNESQDVNSIEQIAMNMRKFFQVNKLNDKADYTGNNTSFWQTIERIGRLEKTEVAFQYLTCDFVSLDMESNAITATTY